MAGSVRAPQTRRRLNRPTPIHRPTLVLRALILGVPLTAGLQGCTATDAPDLSRLRTRAEATDYIETSRHSDVVSFMETVAQASPLIHLTTMGYTHEGRAIPMAVVGDVDDASPDAVRASGKLRVYLQGNIHGGEVPGKEATLMLLREIASGEHADWLDTAVLLVVPLYNADGNERVTLTNRPRQNGPLGGMGQRPNAMGLDLNRDHMKLDSPEARSLVRMLSEYDPHVAVDLHTTNGTRHAYHLTYAEPLNPATPRAVTDLLRGELLPEVTRAVKEKHGWDFYYYGNAFGRGGDEVAWYTYDHRPRFNNNYAGLRNRLGILSEAYAYATFRDRVMATYWFVEEILNFVVPRAEDIQALLAEVDASSVVGEEIAVRGEVQPSPEPVEILMGAVAEEQNPFSGATILRRLDVSTPTTMREFVTFRAAETSVAPSAYLVPADLEVVLDRLRAHGIRMEEVSETGEGPVEVFRIDSTTVNPRPFQGHNERTLFGAYVTEARALSGDWVRVPLDQPLGRLAFYLLEPRSDDGLTNWALLDEALEGAAEYPILRVSAGP